MSQFHGVLLGKKGEKKRKKKQDKTSIYLIHHSCIVHSSLDATARWKFTLLKNSTSHFTVDCTTTTHQVADSEIWLTSGPDLVQSRLLSPGNHRTGDCILCSKFRVPSLDSEQMNPQLSCTPADDERHFSGLTEE